MVDFNRAARLGAMLAAAFCVGAPACAHDLPDAAAISAEVGKAMARTHAQGLALAVIDHGRVGFTGAWGLRDAKGDPLTTETVMYGASLTKTVFAYTVMQLVDQGRLSLDKPLKDDLDQPFFYKGGHDGQTANTLVCLEAAQRCVLILSNDVRSELAFDRLVRFILGDTGVPYDWEYGDYAGKS